MTSRWLSLSIIIPIGPGEREYVNLLADLALYFSGAEIICVFPDSESVPTISAKLISAPHGRAQQLNAGAQAASRPFFWFLHADTRLNPSARSGVVSAMENAPQALSYFNLEFETQTQKPYRLNAWGVRLRSRLFFSPFGDQGFLIHREKFRQSGGFPTKVPYGEDHVFAWRVQQLGIPLYCTGKTLTTSARRYESVGRYTLMWLYHRLWLRQVLPESYRLFRSRGII